jgi:hypothetical protein
LTRTHRLGSVARVASEPQRHYETQSVSVKWEQGGSLFWQAAAGQCPGSELVPNIDNPFGSWCRIDSDSSQGPEAGSLPVAGPSIQGGPRSEPGPSAVAG